MFITPKGFIFFLFVSVKKLDFDPDPESDQELDPELPRKSDPDPEFPVKSNFDPISSEN